MSVVKAVKMIKVTSALPLVLMATQTHLSNFPSNNMEEVCTLPSFPQPFLAYLVVSHPTAG